MLRTLSRIALCGLAAGVAGRDFCRSEQGRADRVKTLWSASPWRAPVRSGVEKWNSFLSGVFAHVLP